METKKKSALERKIGLRVLVFLLIAGLLFVYLNQVFSIGNTDASKEIIQSFYEEEEDTVDVIYMGTSATNRYYNPGLAYEEAGVAAYDLAVMGMPMFFMPTMIEEVEKTQNPSLYIIEIRNVLKSKNEVTDAHIRRVTDSMKFSSNRFEAVDIALDYTEGAKGKLSNIDDEKLSYYVPIVKYHSRATSGELTAGDVFLTDGQSAVKGYVLSPLTVTQKAQGVSIYSDEVGELAPEMADAFEATLRKCDRLKAQGKQILFVLSPYVVKEGEMDKFNAAVAMIREHGYDFLNCNDGAVLEEMNIDWETDFYNSKHVNYKGAEKYTKYLTNYIKDNYEIPDRRGDEAYSSWSEAHEKYCDYVRDGIQHYK